MTKMAFRQTGQVNAKLVYSIAIFAIVTSLAIWIALALSGGESFELRGDDSVIRIGDIELTTEDIRFKREAAETTFEFMRGMQANTTPASQEGARLVDIALNAGIDNVMLASLIVKSAITHEARRRGLSVDENRIAEELITQRALADAGEAPSLVEFAEFVGSAYWTEYLPDVLRRTQLQEALRSQVIRSDPFTDPGIAWADFQRQIVAGAEILIADDIELGDATIDGALEYLEAALASGM